jgi:hypothetical protein
MDPAIPPTEAQAEKTHFNSSLPLHPFHKHAKLGDKTPP